MQDILLFWSSYFLCKWRQWQLFRLSSYFWNFLPIKCVLNPLKIQVYWHTWTEPWHMTKKWKMLSSKNVFNYANYSENICAQLSELNKPFHCNSSANPAQSPRQAWLFFFIAFWYSHLCSHSGFGWSGLFIPHQTIFNQQWSFTHSFQLLWGYWFLRCDIHHVWSCSWKDWKNDTVKDTNECPLCTSWKIKYEQAGSKGGNKIGPKSPVLL